MSTKALIQPSDLQFINRAWLRTAPSGLGDYKFGKGLACRMFPDGLHVYTGSWNPQNVLEWKIPSNFYADATYIRNLGVPPLPFAGAMLQGLYWDEDDGRMYNTGNGQYDATGTGRTLGYANIGPTNTLSANRGLVKFNNRSVKMVEGGQLLVPTEWRTALGGKFLGGFGGYRSVIATGPVSMGMALTSFNPPPITWLGSTTNLLPNTPLCGYPFNRLIAPFNRMNRDTDYINELSFNGGMVGGIPTSVINGEEWPRIVSTGPGHWCWFDFMTQGATWIETPTKSSIALVADMCRGRLWYGSNDPAHPDGTPASSNSWNGRHWLFLFDPRDLEQVALGNIQQDDVQPYSMTPIQFQGVTYPITPGMPSYLINGPIITGMHWINELQKLAIKVSFSVGGQAAVNFYNIGGVVVPPPPPPPGRPACLT